MPDEPDQPKIFTDRSGTVWYVVARVPGDVNAHVLLGALESAGIPARLYREAAGAAIGLTMGLLGMAEILVPEDYYEDALTLLEGPDDSDLLDDGDIPPLDDGQTIDHDPQT